MRQLKKTEFQSVSGGLTSEQQATIAALIASGVLTQADLDGDKWIPSSLSNVRTIGSLQGTIGTRGSGSRLNTN